jgi:hypothetical protein
MTWFRLVRGELRKLTTTKMPAGFVAVLLVMAALNATAVVIGTDMDGSKGFISTAADQRSLMAFAANALIGAGIFGAIAVAREYGHSTVVPMFLTSPRRHRAVLAQLTALFMVGGVLGLIGEALIVGAVALSLPSTDYGFLVGFADVAQLFAASALAGAAGAVLGAGVGALVRNLGGAVAAVVLILFVLPPIAVQLANDLASWMPAALLGVLSGVGTEVSVPAAVVALLGWSVVPAVAGLVSVERRDVV